MKLLLNRIKTPDGTILTSYHRHDFVTHTDKNGEMYGVDGGGEYARRIGNTNECEDLSVWVNEENLDTDFELIRESLHWGTRGKNMDQPLRWVKMSEMSDEHLDALINIYKGPVDPFYKSCFEYEIYHRKKIGLTIKDN